MHGISSTVVVYCCQYFYRYCQSHCLAVRCLVLNIVENKPCLCLCHLHKKFNRSIFTLVTQSAAWVLPESVSCLVLPMPWQASCVQLEGHFRLPQRIHVVRIKRKVSRLIGKAGLAYIHWLLWWYDKLECPEPKLRPEHMLLKSLSTMHASR